MGGLWVSVAYYAVLVGGLASLRRAPANTDPRARAALVGVPVVSIGVFLFVVSEPHHRLFSDFLKAYYVAGVTLLTSPSEMAGLYGEPQYGTCDFVNIPIVAVLFAPFALLSETAAGWVYLAAGLLVCAAAWRSLVRLANLDAQRAALLAVAFAASGPLVNSLKEGNTTHVVLLLLVVSLGCLRGRRDAAAGALLAAAAVIKPPLLLFGPYLFLRGRARAVVAGALLVAVVGLLSVAWFGVAPHRLWYINCVAPFAEHPMAAFNVQSPHGFFARLARGPDALEDWVPRAIPGAFVFAADASVVLMLAAAAVALLRAWRFADARSRLGAAANAAEDVSFCCVLMLCLLTSPMTWSHYYTWTLLPVALMLAPGSRLIPSRAWLAIAAAATLLVLTPVTAPVAAESTGAALYTYVLSSMLLFGGVLLLVLCVRALWTIDAHVPVHTQTPTPAATPTRTPAPARAR